MRKSSILENASFNPDKIHERLMHETENVQVKSLHLKAGQEMPLRSFENYGESMLVVLSGEGKLLGKHGVLDTLVRGDVVITDLRVPHGLRAVKDMSVLAHLTQIKKTDE